MGKTTLVKKVYDDVSLRSHFTHVMWNTVSESFKMEELLKATIRRLLKEQKRHISREELDDLDLDGVKQLILESLQSKKYLVVFDDVWSQTDWDAIHLAFPRNKCGSRVLITTRNLELSETASNVEDGGFVYPLKPLHEEEARWLFCKTTFGDSKPCPKHLTRVCQSILGACEGLPLAIVVIGSTLATKSRTEEWDMFCRSLGDVCESNKKMNVMMKLLSLSYYDLPSHLRICLLYLSIFPEDAFIEKMRLVRLWAAEGLVNQIQGMTVEEVAEGYLYELVKRSLVQVAEFHTDGRIKSVRIHDIVRIIILLKANEQNIATIINSKRLQFLPSKTRRLTIHVTFENMNELECTCKSLRSLVLHDSRGHISKTCLQNLLFNGRRLVKVLDLRNASFSEIPSEIFTLVHLKYFSLRNTKVTSIPKSIGKLQNLETLDLKQTHVKELPVEILKLHKLRHILLYLYIIYPPGTNPFRVGSGFRAPYQIGGLKFLQKLSYIEADVIGEVKIVKEIGKLTQLRRLGIIKVRREDGKELCSSLGKLTQLCSLSVVSVDEEEVIDLKYCLSSNLPYLRTLYITGRLEKPPKWISSLQGLTGIIFRYSRLRSDPLPYLQDLPNLNYFYLDHAYEGEELCFKAGGFPSLKRLIFTSLPELTRLIVEESSMPLLEELKLQECKSMVEFPASIHHLVSLQRLQFDDMSSNILNELENMDRESKKHQWILQVPMVVIRNSINGEWCSRSLDQATGNFIGRDLYAGKSSHNFHTLPFAYNFHHLQLR